MSGRPTVEVRKISFLGDEATGKSSLIAGFMNIPFDSSYKETIGVDFVSKTINLENKIIKLQIWDSAGHQRFISPNSSYLKNVAINFIVFDVTNQSSYNSVSKWINKALEESPDCFIMLVANKADLIKKRVIRHETIADFASAQNLTVFETSAKTRLNVYALFRQCVELPLPTPKPFSSKPKKNNYPALHQLVNKLRSDHLITKDIVAIADILQFGLNTDNPQDYFNQQFQATASLTVQDSIKYHLNQLAWTSKSLCNTVLNVLVTVFFGISVVGLPLAYCFGILEQNQKTHGHSFMFFAFGEKQQGISVSNQVFSELGVDCCM